MTDEEIKLAKEAQRRWAREYRQAHPEKHREAIQRYWLKRALREQAAAAAAKEEADGQPEE